MQMRQRAESAGLEYAEREIAGYAEEKASLTTTNHRLGEENMILKDEVMELKAMVEVLKSQHTNRRGLVSEPSRSPVSYDRL
jgi:predicted RNase H-like nuclease (RuvC/YqgF family)